jgi:hypothetical protein
MKRPFGLAALTRERFARPPNTRREIPMTRNRLIAAILVVLAAAGIPLATAAGGEDRGPSAHRRDLEFDVAEAGTRFSFDETPAFEDGLPAYGTEFVTQGYLYPAGTLDDSNGVLPDGSPEFPDLVEGEWTCRGWFIGDGAHTTTGPWVITAQVFSIGDTPGETTIITDGYELSDAGEEVARAIVGGTGRYRLAAGTQYQTLLGFNGSEGVNLRVRLDVARR